MKIAGAFTAWQDMSSEISYMRFHAIVGGVQQRHLLATPQQVSEIIDIDDDDDFAENDPLNDVVDYYCARWNTEYGEEEMR